jgi:hypothetical protein
VAGAAGRKDKQLVYLKIQITLHIKENHCQYQCRFV